MLPVPPYEIVDLVDVRNGEFVLDGDATEEQRRVFEQWRAEVAKLKAETDPVAE